MTPSTGEATPVRLVSTKHYVAPLLEQFQLMVEHLIVQAHRTGRNVWTSTPVQGAPAGVAVSLGAVWITESQYATRFTVPIPEPAAISSYVPQGDPLANPVIQRPVMDFMDAVDEAAARARGNRDSKPEVFFPSTDPRYPSVLVTLAPQGQ